MSYEAAGTVKSVSPTKQVSERFCKREFIVELGGGGKYPQSVQFQATGDRCDQLDKVHVDDKVLVEFNLRGREWTSPSGEVKHFNTLDVWKVTIVEEAPQKPLPKTGGGDGDDIPFASCDLAHEPNPIARVIR